MKNLNFDFLPDKSLADETWFVSKRIEGIIGAHLFPFFLRGTTLPGDNGLVSLDTKLGVCNSVAIAEENVEEPKQEDQTIQRV